MLAAATAACAQIDLDQLLKGLPQIPPSGAIGDVKIGQALATT
jgi:hypothetical protein